MNFRIADFQALLLAGMVCAVLPAAQAQSAGGTQRIVFSSPEGQITSNAPIPMAQAPQARERPDLPAGGVVIHGFSAPMIAPMYPLPLPMLQQPNAGGQGDSLDSKDIRKEMGVQTSAQIMNVPSPEKIFGLPEKKRGDAQKEPWQLDNALDNENGATNNYDSDMTAIIAEPSWAKLWTQKPGKSTESSNTTDRASGFFGKFFESGQNDSGFGDHQANNDDTFFGSAQSARQQSSWDSGLSVGGLMPPAPAAVAAPSSFTPAGSSSGFGSQQSPFAAPQVSSMSTMPKLPSLPSLPGKKNQLPQPASTPSWTPQPPPWTQAQTPFGTPVPINPALKR